MTLQLPSHLQNRQYRGIAEKAAAGLGASLPPHISIRGNSFTLVDAAGAEYNAGPVLDIVVVDSSGNPGPRRYYKDKWKPDSNEPPTCFSRNGVTPSVEAMEQQARTCAECEWGKRGSKISEMSGVAIKACRDEKWLAVLLPQYPNMLFQLVITPGSFANWKAYDKNFGKGVDITDVVTRISFQAQVNGVLCFEILGYAQNSPQFISADILQVLEKAWQSEATKILVGLDEPATALPAPTQVQQPSPLPVQEAAPSFTPMAQPQVQQLATVTSAAPSEPARPHRRRRTQAEIQAANAQPQQQAAAPMQQPAPFVPQTAPFMPQPAATAGQPSGGPAAGNGAQFGMAPGAQPNPELTKVLDGLFGQK